MYQGTDQFQSSANMASRGRGNRGRSGGRRGGGRFNSSRNGQNNNNNQSYANNNQGNSSQVTKRRPVKSARRLIMKQINVIFAMRNTISTVGDQQELMVLIQIGMRTAGPLTISPANLTR
jgi:hypothetical protein